MAGACKSVQVSADVLFAGRFFADELASSNALKQLREIAIPQGAPGAVKKTASSKTSLPDCCICEYRSSSEIPHNQLMDQYAGLFAVTIQQALFIAPCSHAFHYKCIRPLLETHHPAFSCPLCRTFANLEEDVEVDVEVDEASSAEVSAVMAAMTPGTPVPPIPEHSRERERDRDAGAETEVAGLDGEVPHVWASMGEFRHTKWPMYTRAWV